VKTKIVVFIWTRPAWMSRSKNRRIRRLRGISETEINSRNLLRKKFERRNLCLELIQDWFMSNWSVFWLYTIKLTLSSSDKKLSSSSESF
jgi:hypothetical protein